MNVESTSINSVDNSLPLGRENESLDEEKTSFVPDGLALTEAKEAEAEIESDLPEPDRENITVLTHKLPNKPILPWNHYDSPWHEENKEADKPLEDEDSLGDGDEVE